MLRFFFLALRSTCKRFKLELGFSSEQQFQHFRAQSKAVKSYRLVSLWGQCSQKCKLFVNNVKMQVPVSVGGPLNSLQRYLLVTGLGMGKVTHLARNKISDWSLSKWVDLCTGIKSWEYWRGESLQPLCGQWEFGQWLENSVFDKWGEAE